MFDRKIYQKRKNAEHYANNSEQILHRSKNIRIRNRKIVDEAKSGGCIICLESAPVCLDFHHTDPSEKEFAVSQIMGFSVSKIQTEIDKCVVLCANCHRKLHAGLIIL